MSLSADLFAQAKLLASMDRGKPRQANLRRAISSAYYGFFHLLSEEAARKLSPPVPQRLATRIARAFVHEEMRQVCKSISDGNPSQILLELQPTGFTSDLRLVAGIFVELQEARHRADYDLIATYNRPEVLSLLERAEVALKIWGHIRARDEATVFLTALLLAKKWAR